LPFHVVRTLSACQALVDINTYCRTLNPERRDIAPTARRQRRWHCYNPLRRRLPALIGATFPLDLMFYMYYIMTRDTAGKPYTKRPKSGGNDGGFGIVLEIAENRPRQIMASEWLSTPCGWSQNQLKTLTPAKLPVTTSPPTTMAVGMFISYLGRHFFFFLADFGSTRMVLTATHLP